MEIRGDAHDAQAKFSRLKRWWRPPVGITGIVSGAASVRNRWTPLRCVTLWGNFDFFFFGCLFAFLIGFHGVLPVFQNGIAGFA